MALRKILLHDNPMLHKTSRPVTDFGRKTAELMDDLRETMLTAEGAGLAAPQVGILRRACVILDGEEIVELINPEILQVSEETVGLYEGCLSCPDMRGYLDRPRQVTFKAQNRDGSWFERTCEEMAARAVCHETEHLDGRLFIDMVDRIYTEAEMIEMCGDEESEGEDAPEKEAGA